MHIDTRLLPAAAIALSLFAAPLPADEAGGYAVYQSESSFEDVMDALKLAIQERGMYINNVMHMDEMLDRTGKDLGMDEDIYTAADSIEFCSAVLSRKMTSEDPIRIVNCPFIISVYRLPDEPDTTYLAHRTFPAEEIEGSAVMKEVAEMLQGIAEAAASW
ncbi:MAG: DUF302 domain-containing protein [Thiohalocapsa sp.]|nr:DUF302 domain-containing protein [Thiohalocapsa sp.]MCF7990863.1 DUF302 domain-containing protein [Thiohalocapsa sp.]